jgi:hypothetical protein
MERPTIVDHLDRLSRPLVDHTDDGAERSDLWAAVVAF